MFIARFFLGIGIGPKSATVPIYAAETSPPAIRGALVVQWQMWTAFGTFFGYVADLAFYSVPDPPGVVGLKWRLMMGSAMLPALVVIAFVFMCPESPLRYMSKNRHYKAYQSMVRLRYEKVQAARDVYYMHTLLEAEREIEANQGKSLLELIKIPRNRRATMASEIVMFMQQVSHGWKALWQTIPLMFGIVLRSQHHCVLLIPNLLGWWLLARISPDLVPRVWVGELVFAIPAVYTIDTFGRRNLLLMTFPIPEDTMHTTRVACISLGIYLFGVVYSPGEGPVPFNYSAEAYPLYIRTVGMSLATSTTWFFNFVLSIT